MRAGSSTATTPRGIKQRVGRAAILIGAITVLARGVGFGRSLVFAHTVRNTCLGTAYATANQVPNIVFDIVAGGALASIVVPVLAGPAERRGTDASAADDTRRIASALLTWTLVVLIPLSVLAVLVTRPVVTALLRSPPRCGSDVIAVSARMLAVFAPQIALYGAAVVLYGVLQAHNRFLAPALAPLVSSIVVSAAYVAFVPLGHGDQDRLGVLSRSAELTLSVGTTLGVVALVGTALVPAARLRLGLRPTLRFPPGVAARVRRLALAGIATLVAQDLSVVVVVVLSNGHGGRGALVLYNYAWAVFQLPYAVLAVSVATSVFPLLSARASAGDDRSLDEFDATTAASTRTVVLVSFLGAALLAGAALPVARTFVSAADGRELMFTLVAFAPGVVGYGLVAHLGRVLYAAGRGRVAALATVAGWLVVILADVVIVAEVPARWVVPALGLGNTIGMTVAGAALLTPLTRARSSAALRGLPRAAVAGLLGGLAGYAGAAGVAVAISVSGFLPNAGVAILACVVAAAAFLVVSYLIDGDDLRSVVSRRLAREDRS